jgi:hypothetical protein
MSPLWVNARRWRAGKPPVPVSLVPQGIITGGWGVVFKTLSLARATPVGLPLPLLCRRASAT